jgi:hypothetical protein
VRSFFLGFPAYTSQCPLFSRGGAALVCSLLVLLGRVLGGYWLALDYLLSPAHFVFSIKPLAEGLPG